MTQIYHFAKAMAHALLQFFAILEHLLFWRILRVFGVDLLVEHFSCGSRDVFWVFLNISIFDPNWRFCKGYSPCIIAHFSDFKTQVIFPTLGVFGVYFCLEHFFCGSRDVFRMFLNIFIFDPNWRFCKDYSACIIAHFSDFGTFVIFRLLGGFGVDFCLEHFSCGSRDVFRMFFSISIFDPNWPFCKGYSPCIIAHFSDFKTQVILPTLGVFGVDFCLEHFFCGSRVVFCMFFNIQFLTEIHHFAKAIAHALLEIFLSLEHSLFFEY